MKRFFVGALAFALLVGCSSTEGLKKVNPDTCGVNSEKLSQVDPVIEAAIKDGTIPGAVLSVVRDDKIVYLKAYGNKQVVPDTVAMTTDAMFDLASLSKCVGTTLSFMQLVENGQVRLIDNVNRFIPDFKPWVDPKTGETINIEVRDLLTHTSGLDSYYNGDRFVQRFGENKPDSLIRLIATEVGRNHEPKKDHIYSCLNFITLQNILQNITGQKLCDYAQEHVFDVLGLKSTCYMPKGDLLKRCVPTEVQANGLPLVGEVHDPLARLANGGNSGNAGVFSTAEDLSVIAAALMNGGAINGNRILSPLTVETMATVPDYIDPWIGRALGWDNYSDAAGIRGDFFSRDKTICHTGYTGTSMIVDLENKTAVILLTSRVHPEDKGSVSRLRAQVANIVAGSIEDLNKGVN